MTPSMIDLLRSLSPVFDVALPSEHDLSLLLDEVLARRIIGAYRLDLAYISGSLIEGLGNKGSDLDLYVIVQSEAAETRRPVILNDTPEGAPFRIDLELWETSRVDRLRARLLALRFGEERMVGRIDNVEERFLHRLHLAIPHRDAARLRALQRYLPQALFAQYFLEKNVAICHEVSEDLWGAVDSRDCWAVLVRSRNLVEHSVDALAASYGRTNPSPKWRLHKFMKLADDGLVADGTARSALPHLIGIGESELHDFDPERFAEAAFAVSGEMLREAFRQSIA